MIDQYDTLQPADVVESCPRDGYEDVVAYGTYLLQEGNATEEAQHQGIIGLGELGEEGLAIHQIIECPSYGIFDLQWSTKPVHTRGEPVLAATSTIGTIELFLLKDKKLELWMSSTKEETAMYTSIDWNNKRTTDVSPLLAVSQSNGRLSTWKLEDDGLHCVNRWDAHTLYGAEIEVWSTAFDCFDSNLLFSGADDGILKMWDLRTNLNQSSLVEQKTAHEMGICCVRSHPSIEHLFATGSYDEFIHLWDKRRMNSPVHSFKSEGGVWNLKWNPQSLSRDASTLIAACMHGGCEVLQVNIAQQDGNNDNASVDTLNATSKRIKQYKGHKSIAYGIDYWYKRENLMNPRVFISCSFYDHAIHVWKI